MEFDLGLLAANKEQALQHEALQLSRAYENSKEYRIEWINDSAIEEAARSNYTTFNVAARDLIIEHIQARPGQDRQPYRPLDSADANRIAVRLRDQPYKGPTELFQNADTLRANRLLAQSIVAAVNELYALQEQSRESRSSAAATPTRSAVSPKPLVRKRFDVRRGKRGTRIHVRLPRKAVRKLRKRASRKSRRVAVRVVVSFKAKPRPIVRFIDLGLKIKR